MLTEDREEKGSRGGRAQKRRHRWWLEPRPQACRRRGRHSVGSTRRLTSLHLGWEDPEPRTADWISTGASLGQAASLMVPKTSASQCSGSHLRDPVARSRFLPFQWTVFP